MKKTLLVGAISVLFSSAFAQNIITKGDFKNLTHLTETNELYRVANYADAITQITNPTITAAQALSKGEWYKKSAASGYYTATLVENETLADGTIGNAAHMVRKGSTLNFNHNCLTTYFDLELTKEYTLTFDFKPTTDIENYNKLIYIYVRPIYNNNVGTSAIGTSFKAEDFVALENGWYRLTKHFNTNNSENTLHYFSVAVDGVANSADFKYDYLISNVSITPKNTETAIADVQKNPFQVSANGNAIFVKANNASLEVTDLTGRIVKQVNHIHESAQIEVAKGGIYLVTVKTAEKTATTKVFVK